jgi:hypothetical protein
VGRRKCNIWHIVYGVVLQGNFFLSHSYERSKGFKNFSEEVAFRRKLQKPMCKTAQNVFSSTAGNEKPVHSVWILFTKFKAIY